MRVRNNKKKTGEEKKEQDEQLDWEIGMKREKEVFCVCASVRHEPLGFF